MIVNLRYAVRGLWWLSLLFLAGCATTRTTHNVHFSLVEDATPDVPARIVVITPDITVSEISAGSVIEEVPEWSAHATQVVMSALKAYVAERPDVELVTLPDLDIKERALLKEFRALYDITSGSAFFATSLGGDAWQHKYARFDYTLGPGLEFLRERTGADAALFIVGEDYVSSAGRVGTAVVGALLGVGVQLGHSFLSFGVVDLDNGDLLWLNYTVAYASRNLRDHEDDAYMIEDLLEDFPGIEYVRKSLADTGTER